MGVLYNLKHERYAQGVASGLEKREAYAQAGYKGNGRAYARVDAEPTVKARIKELMEQGARRVELSRKDILERILQDWDLARKLGQVAAALKAGELIGREVHKMFTERREVGGPGDFDNKSEEELRQIVQEGLRDLGWEDGTPPASSSIN